MAGDNLARIQRVSLREGWPNEARDFTPWLAQNLGELGAALSVDLELQNPAGPAGTLAPGLLAADRSDGRPVVIESQLQPTDNDQLSHLLLSAAGQNAKMVVWVAREIGTEHRQILDWLNQRAGEETQFYGVAVELWKIDNSRAAPYFSVVTAPNEWRKRNISNRQGAVAVSRRESTANFHRQLVEKLEREHNHTVAERPGSRGSWCILENLAGKDHYSADFAAKLQVNLWLYDLPTDAGRRERLFEQLKERQERVEAELCDRDVGEWLEWSTANHSGGRASGASVFRGDDFHRNPEAWGEYHDWIIAKFFRFREVFTPLLAELTAAGDGG